jgi:hypothetical protein
MADITLDDIFGAVKGTRPLSPEQRQQIIQGGRDIGNFLLEGSGLGIALEGARQREVNPNLSLGEILSAAGLGAITRGKSKGGFKPKIIKGGKGKKVEKVTKATLGGRQIPLKDPVFKSRAELRPDHPFLVFDARKDTGFEGVFDSEEEAMKFISSAPNSKFLDFGTPRDIESLNPSGPEDIGFMMRRLRNIIDSARAANEP